jgi:hypothetical protein
MSLVPLVLRIITVKALRGQTYALERVLDSNLDAIDMTVTQDKSPVIIVSSDDEEYSLENGKLALTAADRAVDIVIESAVASMVEAADGTQQLTIPHTDAGMEAILGIMGRQIMRALLTPQTPWSDLWRRAVVGVPKVMIRRGASAEQGVRFAARQMVISCRTLHEPGFGRAIGAGEFWDDLLALMAADADLADLGRIIRGEIEGPALASYDQAAAALGISRSAAGMLGTGGLVPGGSDPAAPFSSVEFGGATYDETAIEEATAP